MPNQRAAGTHVRSIPMPDDLWALVVIAAEADGVSASEVVRVALRGALRA